MAKSVMYSRAIIQKPQLKNLFFIVSKANKETLKFGLFQIIRQK